MEAIVAYCEYVYQRYGRFPACLEPCHCVVGFRVQHLDVDFHDLHYPPEALPDGVCRIERGRVLRHACAACG